MAKRKLNALHLFADMLEQCDDLMTLVIVMSVIHAMTDKIVDQLMVILVTESEGTNDEY